MNLKPCPFCGEMAEADAMRGFVNYKGKSANAAAIYCLGCEVEFSMCHEDYPEYTIEQIMHIITERWNRRASATTPPRNIEG